jgi:uncharacterized membrane protein YozB (DUF420 family)
MLSYAILPTVNACLNASSGLLMIFGVIAIARKRTQAHIIYMCLAITASTLFLISYLIYHAHAGSRPFPGQGWVRSLYCTILVSHSILAVIIVPLVARTVYLAARARYDAHKAWARWTVPLWFYVSVTGIIVYWMLYRIDWNIA